MPSTDTSYVTKNGKHATQVLVYTVYGCTASGS